MSSVQERYIPIPVGVNATVRFLRQQIGFFAAITAGTITIEDDAGVDVLTAFPVSAGVVYPLPMYIGPRGGNIIAAGGASGTLGQ